MKTKKIRRILAVALVLAVCVPFTVAAEPPNWKYLGYSVFDNSSIIFKSTGGKFKFCIDWGSAGGTYTLYEQDPYNPDDKVGSYYMPRGSCTVVDVSKFTDGTDKKAELYLAICNWCKDRPYSTRADFWD